MLMAECLDCQKNWVTVVIVMDVAAEEEMRGCALPKSFPGVFPFQPSIFGNHS